MRISLTLLVLVAGAVLFWLLRSAAPDEPLGIGPLSIRNAPSRVEPPLERAVEAPRELSSPDAPTAESFLAEYWGDQWPVVKEALDAAGVD